MNVSPPITSPHGRIFTHTGDIPAAGADGFIAIPARRRWLVHAVFFTLVTDANAANRTVLLMVDDGTDTLARVNLTSLLTASQTWTLSFAPFPVGETLVGLSLFHPLPRFPLAASSRIGTITSSIQVGDQYAAPLALVEEWIDP